jgi:hypothetical protein
MPKRQQSIAPFEHVQVDLCPDGVGMILSVGSVSLWLPEPTAQEVARKLQAALCDTPGVVARGFPRSEPDGSN